MFAVTVAPAVAWLERRRVPRWLGASLVTLAAAFALGALLIAVAVPLVSQSRDLLGNLPHLAHDLFKPGGPLAFADRRFHIERRIGVITPGRLFDLVAGPRSLVSLFTRTAEIVAAVVTIVTITVMLLVEGPRAWKAFIESLGASREQLGDVADRMQRSVAGYVRGNLLVSLLAGAGAFIAMTILTCPSRCRSRWRWACWTCPSRRRDPRRRAVRVRGPVGRLAGSRHPHRLLRRLPADREPFLAPVIYSRTVAMSPLTVLLVSLAGAVLGGIVGVLIAIPLASAGRSPWESSCAARGVEDLADLAEVITEETPEEGPVPLSEDDAEVRGDEVAHSGVQGRSRHAA